MPKALQKLIISHHNGSKDEMECLELHPMKDTLYRSRKDLIELLEREGTYELINKTVPMNLFLNSFEYRTETTELQGYFSYLPAFLKHEDVDTAIGYLKQYLWANYATREIEVYIPVFSINLRRFVFCSVSFQQDVAGNWKHSVDTYSIRMDLYYASVPLLRALLEILFCVIVLGIFAVEVHSMWKIGLKSYFGDSFNYVDLTFIALAAASVGLWVSMVVMLDDLLLAAMDNAKGNIKVLIIGQYVRRLTEFYCVNVCVMVVFLFLRGLQFIGFQPKLSQFNRTIVAAAGPLTNFSVIFCFLFIGLSFIAFVSFGHASNPYHNLPVSLMTSFNMLLTGGDWTGMLFDVGESSVGQTLVYIYYVCFNLFCTWIMINMFLAIVLISYDTVTKERQEALVGEIVIDSTVMDDVRMLLADARLFLKRSCLTMLGMRGKKRQRLEESTLPSSLLEDVVRKECMYFQEFPEGDVRKALKSIDARYPQGITREALFKELSDMLATTESKKKLVLRRPKAKKKKGRLHGDDDGDASSSQANIPVPAPGPANNPVPSPGPASIDSSGNDKEQQMLLKQKQRSDDIQRADSAQSAPSVTPRLPKTPSMTTTRPAGLPSSSSFARRPRVDTGRLDEPLFVASSVYVGAGPTGAAEQDAPAISPQNASASGSQDASANVVENASVGVVPPSPASNPQTASVSTTPSVTGSSEDPADVYSNMGMRFQPNPAALHRGPSMRGRPKASPLLGPMAARREMSNRGRRLSSDSTDSLSPLRPMPDPGPSSSN